MITVISKNNVYFSNKSKVDKTKFNIEKLKKSAGKKDYWDIARLNLWDVLAWSVFLFTAIFAPIILSNQ